MLWMGCVNIFLNGCTFVDEISLHFHGKKCGTSVGTELVFELLYLLLVCSEERLDQSELHHENCISIAFEGCSPTDISLASGFSFCASCFFVAAF